MEDSTQGWTRLGPYFQSQGTFLIFREERSPPNPPPSSPCCTPAGVTHTVNTVIKIISDKTGKKIFIHFNHFACNIIILANFTFNYIQIANYFF